MGISPAQIRHAISLHITKVNVDSDSRLAFTSAVRETLSKNKKVEAKTSTYFFILLFKLIN